MSGRSIIAESSGTRAVHDVALRCLRKAGAALASRQVSDDDVHAARREIKKARAALRLLRTELGESAYHREDAALRAVARPLNALRDDRALLQALQSLRRRYRRRLQDAAAARLTAALAGSLRRARAQHRAMPEPLARSRRRLRLVEHRARRWRVGRHGWSRLGPAFMAVYRAGRRAEAAVRAKPDDRALHRWRRQVKYLGYALQILRPLRQQTLALRARQLRQLGACLGEDHDLALLRQRTLAVAHPDSAAIATLQRAIARRRQALQRRAGALGERAFEPAPLQLARQMNRYWREWRGRCE